MNKSYVPFYRVIEELSSSYVKNRGFANVGKQIKSIKGSGREIIDPIESIIKNTYALINASERNNIGVVMARLANENKEIAKMFEEIDTPMVKMASVKIGDLLGVSQEMIPPEISDVDFEKIIDIFRPSLFPGKDNVLTVLINGEKKFFQVEKQLYKALLAIEAEQLGMIIRLLSIPTRVLRAGATLAPEFVLRNLVRDQFTAFVYSRYGYIPIVDFVRGMFSLFKKDDMYQLWRMGGGEHSMLVSLDREHLQKSLNDVIKDKGALRYVKHPIELLQILSEIIEAGTRLGEARKGIAKMKNPIEAAYASREVTLDFNRIGAKMRSVNALIAFFNARVEGFDRFIREMRDHPLRATLKMAFAITLPSILLYFVNRDEEDWEEIPLWQKDLFWLLKVNGTWYRIPKPFELGVLFGSVPERILEYMDRKDKKLFDQMLKTVADGINVGMIPTALEPIIENMANYNFFYSRRIVPERLDKLPPEAQYTQYTSEVAKKLGELANYSPLKIDNLISGYTAGLGNYVIKAIDEIMRGTGLTPRVTMPSPTIADMPVAKAFVVRSPIGSASQSVNNFYEELEEVEKKEQLLKKYLKDGDRVKFNFYKQKHPELHFQYDWKRKDYYSSTARYYRKVANMISDLRKEQRKIYSSEKLTANEKREKITKIDTLITKLAHDALNSPLVKGRKQ